MCNNPAALGDNWPFEEQPEFGNLKHITHVNWLASRESAREIWLKLVESGFSSTDFDPVDD